MCIIRTPKTKNFSTVLQPMAQELNKTFGTISLDIQDGLKSRCTFIWEKSLFLNTVLTRVTNFEYHFDLAIKLNV